MRALAVGNQEVTFRESGTEDERTETGAQGKDEGQTSA